MGGPATAPTSGTSVPVGAVGGGTNRSGPSTTGAYHEHPLWGGGATKTTSTPSLAGGPSLGGGRGVTPGTFTSAPVGGAHQFEGGPALTGGYGKPASAAPSNAIAPTAGMTRPGAAVGGNMAGGFAHFKEGGLVHKSGLAHVDEGEIVIPAHVVKALNHKNSLAAIKKVMDRAQRRAKSSKKLKKHQSPVSKVLSGK